MVKLLVDQDFDHDILRGLVRRVPTLDVVTAYQIGFSAASDPELLAWAAEAGRVIITHDRKTMPSHTADRMAGGEKILGVIIVPQRRPMRQVINELEVVVMCSDENEWENIILYLPL